MGSVTCPKRGNRMVDLTVCVGICDFRDDCEEFKAVPELEIEEAVRKNSNLPEPAIEGIIEPEVFEEDDEEKEDAGRLLTKALSLRSEIELKFWELGEVLYHIFQNQYFLEYGYPNWKDFCSQVLDIKWRTATYLKDIYGKFTSLGVKGEEIAGVGWVKLKELLPIIDKKNVREWIKVAKDKNISLVQLNARVKYALGKISKEEAERPPRTIGFKLYEEQLESVKRALEIAKRMTGSENYGYLLEMICAEFLITYDTVGENESRLEISKRILSRMEKAFSIEFKGEIIDVRTGEFVRKG